MDPLDELYGAPLEQFMETREALARRLKAAGDKAGAAELKKQHKPTRVAHALNRLVREARPELEALFEAGKALASGKDFKAALERQRAALEAVKAKASGPDVPAIIAVVQGALVDEKLAEAVRLGRFAKLPEAPVGFFGAAPEGAPPVVVPPPPKPVLKVVPPPPESAPRVEAAPPPAPKPDPALLEELRAAEAEAKAAADELSELEAELLDARRRAHEAQERVAKLKKRL